MKFSDMPIGVFDFETDPFLEGRVPMPFSWSVIVPNPPPSPWLAKNRASMSTKFLKNSLSQTTYWGDDSVNTFIDFCESYPKAVVIYAHNGGKFDFWPIINSGMIDPQDLFLMNGRLMKIKIGKVWLIDSYPLIPVALAAYKKDTIDYNKFEKQHREIFKKEIVHYLEKDCEYLLELITGFRNEVGPYWTAASAAFGSLKSFGYDPQSIRLTEHQDEECREYYHGGRVEVRVPGEHHPDKLMTHLDINSAYPHAMTFKHPWGGVMESKKEPESWGPQLVCLEGISFGALPYRTKEGVDFPSDNVVRTYKVTGWEVAAGLDTGTLDIHHIRKVLSAVDLEITDFKPFVDNWWKYRQRAKKKGDLIRDLAAKTILNSCYGKFAINPRNFREYVLTDAVSLPPEHEDASWKLEFDNGLTGHRIWSRPQKNSKKSYVNVMVAASITGFVRAYLWRTICAVETQSPIRNNNNAFAKKPAKVIYCDTDSIVVKGKIPADALKVSDKLGDWKIEGCPSYMAIAGKKLYTMKVKRKWKTASKGCALDKDQIIAVCRGKSIIWKNQAPTFGLSGTSFAERTIVRTA